MKLTHTKSKGFTLVELLVVVAIIAVLAALATPVIMKGLTKASIVKAKGVCSSLETAVTNFESEYNYLPFNPDDGMPDEDNDTDPFRSDEGFMAVLAGVEDTDGSDVLNFKGIRFFELGEPKGNSEASYKDGMKVDNSANTAKLYDPWGETYYVTFDYDLDGQIDNPLEEDEVVGGKKVIIYSYGPDGEFGSTKLNRDNATNF